MCTGVTWGVYGHFLKSRHSSADGATATAIMKSPDPSIPRRQVWHTYACMHACVYVFMYACMYVCVFIGKYRNSNFHFFSQISTKEAWFLKCAQCAASCASTPFSCCLSFSAAGTSLPSAMGTAARLRCSTEIRLPRSIPAFVRGGLSWGPVSKMFGMSGHSFPSGEQVGATLAPVVEA